MTSLAGASSWKRCGRRGVNSATAWRTEAGSNEYIRSIRSGLNWATRGSVADRPGSRTRNGRDPCMFVDTDKRLPRLGRGLTMRVDCPCRIGFRAVCPAADPLLPFRNADADCPWSRTRLLPLRGHGGFEDSDSRGPRLFRGLLAFTDCSWTRPLAVAVARTFRAFPATGLRTRKPTGW